MNRVVSPLVLALCLSISAIGQTPDRYELEEWKSKDGQDANALLQSVNFNKETVTLLIPKTIPWAKLQTKSIKNAQNQAKQIPSARNNFIDAYDHSIEVNEWQELPTQYRKQLVGFLLTGLMLNGKVSEDVCACYSSIESLNEHVAKLEDKILGSQNSKSLLANEVSKAIVELGWNYKKPTEKLPDTPEFTGTIIHVSKSEHFSQIKFVKDDEDWKIIGEFTFSGLYSSSPFLFYNINFYDDNTLVWVDKISFDEIRTNTMKTFSKTLYGLKGDPNDYELRISRD